MTIPYNALAPASAAISTQPMVALAGSGPAALAALRPAAELLDGFGVEFREWTLAARGAGFARTEQFAAEAAGQGLRVLIVGSADAELASTLAARTWLPVIRVPLAVGRRRRGLALLTNGNGKNSGGYATVAIGEAGAKNAALLAVSILALTDPRLHEEWLAFRAAQTEAVLQGPPLIGSQK